MFGLPIGEIGNKYKKNEQHLGEHKASKSTERLFPFQETLEGDLVIDPDQVLEDLLPFINICTCASLYRLPLKANR